MLIVTHGWQCDVPGCSNKASRSRDQEVPFANLVAQPVLLPDGWNLVDRKLVCPRHKVAIGEQGESHEPT